MSSQTNPRWIAKGLLLLSPASCADHRSVALTDTKSLLSFNILSSLIGEVQQMDGGHQSIANISTLW